LRWRVFLRSRGSVGISAMRPICRSILQAMSSRWLRQRKANQFRFSSVPMASYSLFLFALNLDRGAFGGAQRVCGWREAFVPRLEGRDGVERWPVARELMRAI